MNGDSIDSTLPDEGAQGGATPDIGGEPVEQTTASAGGASAAPGTANAPTSPLPSTELPGAIHIPASVIAPVPRPKPVIVAERVEDGWRTEHVLVDRSDDEQGYYVTCIPAGRAPFSVYASHPVFDGLIALATANVVEPGRLWKALSDIPLERPLPSRALEEELRVLLTTFANELRHRW
jgi:hypothetical protein